MITGDSYKNPLISGTHDMPEVTGSKPTPQKPVEVSVQNGFININGNAHSIASEDGKPLNLANMSAEKMKEIVNFIKANPKLFEPGFSSVTLRLDSKNISAQREVGGFFNREQTIKVNSSTLEAFKALGTAFSISKNAAPPQSGSVRSTAQGTAVSTPQTPDRTKPGEKFLGDVGNSVSKYLNSNPTIETTSKLAKDIANQLRDFGAVHQGPEDKSVLKENKEFLTQVFTLANKPEDQVSGDDKKEFIKACVKFSKQESTKIFEHNLNSLMPGWLDEPTKSSKSTPEPLPREKAVRTDAKTELDKMKELISQSRTNSSTGLSSLTHNDAPKTKPDIPRLNLANLQENEESNSSTPPLSPASTTSAPSTSRSGLSSENEEIDSDYEDDFPSDEDWGAHEELEQESAVETPANASVSTSASSEKKDVKTLQTELNKLIDRFNDPKTTKNEGKQLVSLINIAKKTKEMNNPKLNETAVALESKIQEFEAASKELAELEDSNADQNAKFPSLANKGRLLGELNEIVQNLSIPEENTAPAAAQPKAPADARVSTSVSEGPKDVKTLQTELKSLIAELKTEKNEFKQLAYSIKIAEKAKEMNSPKLTEKAEAFDLKLKEFLATSDELTDLEGYLKANPDAVFQKERDKDRLFGELLGLGKTFSIPEENTAPAPAQPKAPADARVSTSVSEGEKDIKKSQNELINFINKFENSSKKNLDTYSTLLLEVANIAENIPPMRGKNELIYKLNECNRNIEMLAIAANTNKALLPEITTERDLLLGELKELVNTLSIPEENKTPAPAQPKAAAKAAETAASQATETQQNKQLAQLKEYIKQADITSGLNPFTSREDDDTDLQVIAHHVTVDCAQILDTKLGKEMIAFREASSKYDIACSLLYENRTSSEQDKASKEIGFEKIKTDFKTQLKQLQNALKNEK